MRFKRSGWALAEWWLAWFLIFGALARVEMTVAAQSAPAIATTAIADTVYNADGTAATGTVLISWPAFSNSAGSSIPAGSTAVTLGAGGTLSVHLVPNAGSTPQGSYYTVVYHLGDGTVTREFWVVPVSSGTVAVNTIRSTVLPTSLAMQTVSKSYVDTAIAAAVTGHSLDSTPYVLKSGDTMTGPLTLSGDPVAPAQASDKNYVDTQIAGVASGLNGKVSLQPQGAQTVSQPPGTQLAVNTLNGVEYASQFVSGAGANGIANATGSANCTSGCEVKVEQTYPAGELVTPTTWNNQTHVEDARGGQTAESFLNPQIAPGFNSAKTVNLTSTQTTNGAAQSALTLNTNALAGGTNIYPAQIQGTVPYFKSTYGALSMTGVNNTLGQHNLISATQSCFAVGDCLLGGEFLVSSGGFRDDADEGTHPFDRVFTEDQRVFTGSCAGGCTAGSSTVQITPTANGGTQGEGRYLLDTNPAKAITGGTLTGAGPLGGRQPSALFAGTNFPVSVFLETAQTVPTQTDNIAPGTVVVPIATSALPGGFAGNTAALPAPAGVACISDVQVLDNRPLNFETAAYAVVDATHLRLTLNRPHSSGATVAVGGLCGYGIEQKADTLNGIRQVFPVIGSDTPTSLLYAGGASSILGVQGSTSAFLNTSLVVASIARNNNVVTVTTVVNLPADLNGLTLTLSSVADASYNGSFPVVTTGPNSFSYANPGPNSTSTAGVATYSNGSFGLYPMAEVLSVYNAATRAVDGQMTLTANTVPWAAGDSVEQPHYFQEGVSDDTDLVSQYTPRAQARATTGVIWGGNNSVGLTGFQVVNNDGAASYFGNGGTHTAPDNGILVQGIWNRSMEMQAGEQSVFAVHCNSHGCGRWNSGYDLFTLDSSGGADRMSYAPNTSTLSLALRGGGYTFSPQGFTAGTINATTVNAGTVIGHLSGSVDAAALPVFQASGSGHGLGAVPDPGAAAGTTRFLREDGTWSIPATGGGTGNGGISTAGPSVAVPALSNVASCAFGLHVHGDSDSVASFGTPALLGWEPQLFTDCGLAPNTTAAVQSGPAWEFAQGGNEAADVSWRIFTNENPGDFGNPLVTLLDLGGNNSNYDAADTVGFQQDAYAALSWPAISSTNKVVMGASAAVSHTGTCTVDTTFANARGLTCSAGAVVTWTASVGPQGVAYLYAKSLPSGAGAGTFTLSSGATVLTDSITAGSTINPFIPAARWYSGSPNTVCANGTPCGAIAARYPGLTYGQQTFHATVLSGTVTLLAFAAPSMNTNSVSPSGPRILMSDIPHAMNYANEGNIEKFDALDLGIAQTLLLDKLNVPYLEMLSVIDVLNDFATTVTTSPNCTASNNPGHWNSCGQNHALAAVEAAIGLAPQNPNPLVTSLGATGAIGAGSLNIGAPGATAGPAASGSIQANNAVVGATLQAGYLGAGNVPVAGSFSVGNNAGTSFSCAGTTNGDGFVNCNTPPAGMYWNGAGALHFQMPVVATSSLFVTPEIHDPTWYFSGTSAVVPGFSGSKTVGSCVFTINHGIITNVTGC